MPWLSCFAYNHTRNCEVESFHIVDNCYQKCLNMTWCYESNTASTMWAGYVITGIGVLSAISVNTFPFVIEKVKNIVSRDLKKDETDIKCQEEEDNSSLPQLAERIKKTQNALHVINFCFIVSGVAMIATSIMNQTEKLEPIENCDRLCFYARSEFLGERNPWS